MPSATPASGCSTPIASERNTNGATAPASAIVEPTERSIPPEAITSVMPIATIAIGATWERLT